MRCYLPLEFFFYFYPYIHIWEVGGGGQRQKRGEGVVLSKLQKNFSIQIILDYSLYYTMR